VALVGLVENIDMTYADTLSSRERFIVYMAIAVYSVLFLFTLVSLPYFVATQKQGPKLLSIIFTFLLLIIILGERICKWSFISHTQSLVRIIYFALMPNGVYE